MLGNGRYITQMRDASNNSNRTTTMTNEIKWTAGTGSVIIVTVSTGYQLDRQGARKTAGMKQVVVSATVDGKRHHCPRGLVPTNHSVAIATLGHIGLIKANYDRVVSAIVAAESEIVEHNNACDAHAASLDAIDTECDALTARMACGE